MSLHACPNQSHVPCMYNYKENKSRNNFLKSGERMKIVTWNGMSHDKAIKQSSSLHKREYNGSLFNTTLNLKAKFLGTVFWNLSLL